MQIKDLSIKIIEYLYKYCFTWTSTRITLIRVYESKLNTPAEFSPKLILELYSVVQTVCTVTVVQ